MEDIWIIFFLKCRYIDGSKTGPLRASNGPVSKWARNWPVITGPFGPVTGPYGPVNFYLYIVVVEVCVVEAVAAVVVAAAAVVVVVAVVVAAAAVVVQYRHLIPAPVDRMSVSAWLYKHPWISCQRISQTH